MALFGSKKTEKKTAAKTAAPVDKTKTAEAPKVEKKPAVNLSRSTDRNLDGVLIKPHMTEKAVGLSERNVYTFEVSSRANKFDVRDAITAVYGVTPTRVNIVKKVARTTLSRTRGRRVTEKGMKKAYVYLKDGDTISVV